VKPASSETRFFRARIFKFASLDYHGCGETPRRKHKLAAFG